MKRYSITQDKIDECPVGDWYIYKLDCGCAVITKVRIIVPKDYSYQEHMAQCPTGQHSDPSKWKFITHMGVALEEIVDKADLRMLVPASKILRTGNPNPYPYSVGKNRDY